MANDVVEIELLEVEVSTLARFLTLMDKTQVLIKDISGFKVAEKDNRSITLYPGAFPKADMLKDVCEGLADLSKQNPETHFYYSFNKVKLHAHPGVTANDLMGFYRGWMAREEQGNL